MSLDWLFGDTLRVNGVVSKKAERDPSSEGCWGVLVAAGVDDVRLAQRAVWSECYVDTGGFREPT